MYRGRRILYILAGLVLMNLLPGAIFSQSQGWKKVSAGTEFSFALHNDGSLWSWGFNFNGQLGNGISGDLIPQTEPAQMNQQKDWVDISCGGVHSVALKTNGTLWAWGSNVVRQIGNSLPQSVPNPVQIHPDGDWQFITCGQGHSLAIKADSSLWSWGLNNAGQLGIGNLNNTGVLQAVGAEQKWIAASGGGYHTLAIDAAGDLWSWGLNLNGQCAHPIVDNIRTPRKVETPQIKWIAVAAGFEYSLGLSENGALYAWGFNGNGQLGTGDNLQRDVPTLIHAGPFNQISAGSAFNYAISEGGELFAWGANIQGVLGLDNGDIDVVSPTKVSDQTDWKQVSTSKGLLANSQVVGFHALAIKEEASSICVSGANYIGQLGTGDTEIRRLRDCSVAPQMVSSTQEKLSSTTEWELFPNPAYEKIIIRNSKLPAPFSWQVRDMQGVFVMEGQSAGSESEVGLSKLPPGTYMILIQSGKEFKQEKFVKL